MASNARERNKRLDVVIVGGSLSGLFAAVMLQSAPQHVASIHILERQQAHEQVDGGAGLRVGKNVQSFVAPYVTAGTTYLANVSGLRVLDGAGSVAQEVPFDGQVTSWGALHGVLQAALARRSEQDDGSDGEGEGGVQVVHMHGCTFTHVAAPPQHDARVQVQYRTTDGTMHTLSADLVVGADGASSRVRAQLLPDLKRTYAGYVVWRGLVPESALSASLLEGYWRGFSEWHWGKDCMFLGYLIPGLGRKVEAGKRDVNWAWYFNTSEDELADIMTDSAGVKHTLTLPMGKARNEVAEMVREAAKKTLPAQMAELVMRTEKPFAQAVTDVLAPENSFFGGKVLLIGDAAAGCRPHIAAATSQAVFHVSRLKDMLDGKIDSKQWSEDCLRASSTCYAAAIDLGEICQYRNIAPAEKAVKFMGRMRRMMSDLEALEAPNF